MPDARLPHRPRAVSRAARRACVRIARRAPATLALLAGCADPDPAGDRGRHEPPRFTKLRSSACNTAVQAAPAWVRRLATARRALEENLLTDDRARALIARIPTRALLEQLRVRQQVATRRAPAPPARRACPRQRRAGAELDGAAPAERRAAAPARGALAEIERELISPGSLPVRPPPGCPE